MANWRYTEVVNLPNPSTVQVVGIDTETYDPDLLEGGPGWGRGWGNVVGISIAIDSKNKFYFPIAHTVEPFDNMPKDQIISYLKDLLSRSIPKVGANLIYDIGWLNTLGIDVKGPHYDIMFAEALIDPNRKDFSLESIAYDYLGVGKTSNALYEWGFKQYGGKIGSAQRANIYRSPPRLVGPYAEDDALLPLKILELQEARLEEYGLVDLFKLECRLIPLLIKMRQRGVPVDILKAHEAREDMLYAEELMQSTINKLAGCKLNVASGKQLAVYFDKAGLSYPKTDKGNPSFTASWLAAQHTKEAKLINDIRKIKKARVSFIENAIIEKSINNKIYPSLHPLRSEDGGTITGRFSSSKPNSQQFPSRDEEFAPIIRGIFVPEEGYTHWCKMDYSQIEYRMFAHFANDQKLIEAYQHRDSDFHSIVGSFLGSNIPRKPVKNINFMMLYGGGIEKLIAMLSDLNLEIDPREFIKLYDAQFPAAKRLMKEISEQVQKRGETRTILNRRTPFDLWIAKHKNKEMEGLPYGQALRLYGANLERANSYKGLNYVLQGSAADLIKKGMIDAFEAGIFDKIGVPHLQVHDELNFSYHPDLHNYFKELVAIMENSIKLKVPVIMEAEIGSSWGDCKQKLEVI